jgi:phosphate acetyltransferase
MDILKLIKDRALEKSNKILLIEGEDERVIEAASMAVKEKVCRPTLLGDRGKIEKAAKEKGISLDGVEVLDYENHPEIDEYAERLAELRKHKGLTKEKAKELLKNPNYFGALMLKLGECDGAVGGCKFSTAEWMRPVFQIIGTKEGVKTVSAVCFFIVKDRVLFFSDTDFSIKPDTEQLAQIAINAADFVKGIGVGPKVALLSYSTKGSGEHPSLQPIRDALEIVKKKRSDILIDGELQLDAAINPEAAKKKCPDSVLKGEANVLVFPDITVGNVLTHGLMQLTDYKFYGSFPVGLAKPIMNGGRSFNAKEIFDAITACAMECNLK